MKIISLLLVTFVTSVSSAASPCADIVENSVARLQSGNNQTRLSTMTTDSDLVQKAGSTLLYSVQIYEGSAPPVFYNVQAIGSEAHCKVTNIQLKGRFY